ncbi:MAG: hypothetical protein WDW38_010040 [Sanguina aurantia]
MYGPGYGLKQLRLVSKAVRAAAQRAVQGYTIKLELRDLPTSKSDQSKVLGFLKASQLLRLRISIPTFATPAADAASIKATSARLTAQLRTLITGAAPALGSINHLNITLPATCGSKEQNAAATAAMTAIVLPLARACPQLQRLTVIGRVGSGFLQYFGSKCPKLTFLETTLTDISRATLLTLPTLLPHLTSLTALSLHSRDDFQFLTAAAKQAQARKNGERACIALTACPGLLSFNSGSCGMSKAMWAALPKGLASLDIPTNSHTMATGITLHHTSLRTLGLNGASVTIHPLVELLAGAPHLTTLRLQEELDVELVLSKGDAQHLQYLDSRLCAGLSVCGASGQSDSSMLRLVCDLAPIYPPLQDATPMDIQHSMTKFMEPEIMSRPLPSFTNVEFNNEGEEEGDQGDLSQLTRVFPNVLELTVNNVELLEDAQILIDCKSLQTLTFIDVDGVSRSSMETLCKYSKSLRSAHLIGCRGLSAEDGDWIMRTGAKLSGVSVVVERGRRLEEEDMEEAEREFSEEGYHRHADSYDDDEDDGSCGYSED